MKRRRDGILMISLVGLVFSSAAAAQDPVIVTDDRGRAVTILHVPQRIVAVGALYAQVLVDLGLKERLVAAADSPDNPPEAAGLPSVGPSYAPSIETILSLAPDLVLGATDWGGERPALEAAGITVLTTPLLTSIADVLDAVRILGTAVGLSQQATGLADRIAQEILVAEERILGLPRVRCAFLYPPSLGAPPYAAGIGTLENELIRRAGGENVFADTENFPQVNVEELLVRDPAVIFAAPAQVSHITEDPLLQGLSAVRLGRVFGIRASRAASTAVAEVLVEMALRLHPE